MLLFYNTNTAIEQSSTLHVAVETLRLTFSLVLLTSRCVKVFHSELKHAYHPVGIQYSDTRYNNLD